MARVPVGGVPAPDDLRERRPHGHRLLQPLT
jgi:hypothetical protein